MHPHLTDVVADTLGDTRILEHRVVETDEELVLMLRVRSRDARQLREKLKTELLQSDTRATVVLISSARQHLDLSKWSGTKPTALRRADALRMGAYLLT